MALYLRSYDGLPVRRRIVWRSPRDRTTDFQSVAASYGALPATVRRTSQSVAASYGTLPVSYDGLPVRRRVVWRSPRDRTTDFQSVAAVCDGLAGMALANRPRRGAANAEAKAVANGRSPGCLGSPAGYARKHR
jgi:hypothetical protein